MTEVQLGGADIAIVDEYPAPHCRASGAVAARLFAPDDMIIWRIEASVPSGTVLSWGQDHGDEVVFVQEGAVRVGDVTVPAGGAAVVESGVATSVETLGDAVLLHFGGSDPQAPADGELGPPAPDGHGVHLYGPEGKASKSGPRPTGYDMSTCYFADSTCTTCRLTLLKVSSSDPVRGRSHYHTQDELIHVTRGELRVGPIKVPAGTTIAVPKDRRYSFVGVGDWEFVNYRRDISRIYYSADDWMMETADGIGCTTRTPALTG